ncbi:flagellar hook-length control protein FliK [Massilia jejuensis]|uniref:Flagellar hook-length control protein FliK n=1 Tax=Massilia jejuensis TaxID=648894 RepID=A0ABW0PED4_9BURK
MNLTSTNMNQPALAANGAAPAANDGAGPDAAGAAPAPGAVQLAPAQPALAFAQWLGLEQLAPVHAEAPPATAQAAPAATDASADEQQQQQQNADAPLLGAMTMSMPLMPAAQAALALVAALPGVPAARQSAPAPTQSAPAAATALSLPAESAAPGRAGRAELAAAAPVPAAVLPSVETPLQAAPAPAAVTAKAAGAAPALPAETPPSSAAPADQPAPATERGAAHTAGIAAPATTGAQRTMDTVALSGPPTAWRQTLQEALGERLQLQVGKSAEQAVIRLDPPMLGRVEIAIRHSAGALEVHISATHGEVLRQLQSVGEGLRNDLVQRQFTEVSVNIAQAPRGAGGSPAFAGGDGRGRQQDERQTEQHPGNALAEAHTGNAPFALDGRG